MSIQCFLVALGGSNYFRNPANNDFERCTAMVLCRHVLWGSFTCFPLRPGRKQ